MDNPYQPPQTDTFDCAPQKRAFQFEGNLSYDEYQLLTKKASGSAVGDWLTLLGFLVVFGVMVASFVMKGQSSIDVLLEFFTAPMVIIAVLAVAGAIGIIFWGKRELKRQAQAGEGVFEKTRYQLDDDVIAVQTKLSQSQWTWAAFGEVKANEQFIRLFLVKPNVGEIIFVKRWFEDDIQDWHDLQKFVAEKFAARQSTITDD